MRYILVLFLMITLGACDNTKIFEKPVIQTRPKLVLPDPMPVSQLPLEWVVVTKDTELTKLLGDDGWALVALSPDGYKNLSLNEAEMRRYILQLRTILEEYRQYQEGDKDGPG